MDLKKIFFALFVLFITALIFFYFMPFGTINFWAKTNSNFSIKNETDNMQFYPNMRFPDSKISYGIANCTLQKQNEMEAAFDIMENSTPLRFYPSSNAEISVTCNEKDKISDGLFIAGEGGPTSVIITGEFSIITEGQILLIRDSNCERPNVALHELLHVLGFTHSTNPENIMYNVTNCRQTMGEDMIQLINNLYSIQSNPDLLFKNVSASMSGRFLNINMTIINAGLKRAEKSKINIYTDNSFLKKIDLEPLEMGTGRIITINNVFVTKFSVSELELSIDSDFNEINKENNKIKLEIKK